MFMPDSLPSALRTRLEQRASPMPAFSALDEYDEPQHNCAAKYSHPTFFIEQWVISERQRQKQLEEQRLKKREERRARRKLDRTRQTDGTGRIAVTAVKKKQYNVHGQEFAGTDVAVAQAERLPAPSPIATKTQPEVPFVDMDSRSSRHSLASEEAGTVEEDMSRRSSAMQAVSQPPPIPPPLPPPLPTTVSSQMPPPPPLPPPLPAFDRQASVGSDRGQEPEPMPSGSYDHVAPPTPPPPPQADPRAALLAGIQRGTVLKSVGSVPSTPPPPPQVSDRDNLLAQIRQGGGKVLKATPKPAKATPKSDDAYSEIKALLDRRQFLAPVDSDGDDADDGYDSDDWKE